MVSRVATTLLAIAVVWPSVVLAQATKAGVVTTLEGLVTVTRAASPQPVPLKFKDDVFLEDKITAGNGAIARLLLGGKAIVTLQELSTLTIRHVSGQATIEVESGKIGLAVARDRMRPGETIVIRTANAVGVVRDTVVVAEVVRQSAQVTPAVPAVVTNFYVLRGTFLAAQFNPVTRVTSTPIVVNPLQGFSAAGAAPPRVAPIPPAQVAAITAGLKPQAPVYKEGGAGKEAVKAQVMQTTAALLTALVGPTPGTATPTTGPARRETTPGDGTAGGPPQGPSPGTAPPTSAPPAAVFTPSAAATLFGAFTGGTGAEALAAIFGPPPGAEGGTTGTQPGGGGAGMALPGLVPSVPGGGPGIIPGATGVPGVGLNPGAEGATAAPGSGGTLTPPTVAGGFTLPPLPATGGVVPGTGGSGPTPVAVLGTPTLALAPPTFTTGPGPTTPTIFFIPTTANLFAPLPTTTPTPATKPATTTAEIATPPPNATTTTPPPTITPTPTTLTTTAPTTEPTPPAPTPTPPPPTTTTGAPQLEITGAVSGPVFTFSGVTSRGVTAPQFQISGGASVTGPSTGGVINFNSGASLVTSSPLVHVIGGSTVNSTNASFNTRTGNNIPMSGSGPLNVAITPDGAAAYVTSSATSDVSVINTATSAVSSPISVSGSSLGVAITPAGTRAYVVEDSNGSVSVFNTATNDQEASIGVGLGPQKVAITPNGTLAYVTNSGDSTVSVINTADHTEVAGSPVTVGSQPYGVAITPNGTRAYVANSGDGTVSVINTADHTEVAGSPITVGASPLGVAITPNGTRAYVTNSSDNSISVIDTATNTVIGAINGVAQPREVAITADGTRAYVTTSAGDSVTVISTATNTVIATIAVGTSPEGLAITPNGLQAYVVNSSDETVSVLDVNPGAPFLNVPAGATITSTSSEALISFTSSTVNAGSAIVKLSGRDSVTTTEDAENGLPIVTGADQPIFHTGTFLQASAATVTAEKGVLLDNALLAATAPIFHLLAGSTMTTNTEALDLSYRAKVTSTGPIFKLDGSTLTVNKGAVVNVGGGSILRTSSDLFQLHNGATLRTLNGPLLNVAGGSVANITGGLISFGGTGGNTVSVTNSLCPCTTFSGIPVALTGGATNANVSITNPIKNSSLGTVTTSANAAVIVVNGSTSKVIVGGQ